ncbi:MAG: phage tail protein [Oscillospiraceae bacterium]|nr:phage tail protein [Oscillospiraceae bacterium]
MANVYHDPFRSFRFLVELESGAAVVAAFSQFSGVKFEVEQLEARGGNDSRGVPERISTLTKFSPVTLTKGVVGDEAFLDWLFSAAAGMNSGPQPGVGPRTINVVALDDRGRRGIVWTLKDAYPIAYELAPMNSESSAVLSESMTFSIRGVERKTNAPPSLISPLFWR